jgi:hypothetical protein
VEGSTTGSSCCSGMLEVEAEDTWRLEVELKVDKIELRRFIIPGFSPDFAFSSVFPFAFAF